MDTTVREAELGESAEACKARTNCYCPTCGDIYINGEDSCAKDQTALVPCEEVDPLIGEVIASTFKLIRPLARGAMGQLYEAEHVRLGRKFAVKVLHESFRERREAKIRFEREAAALAKIRSENVVAVIDATLTRDGRPAIVTEFLQGRDLSQRLVNNGKL